MGKYEQGILGAFSGLVGPVVGSSFRGINVMRGKPKKTTKLPTLNQLAQRAKFAAVTKFLTPASSILGEHFAAPTGAKSRYNLATSYHLQEAVEWDGTEATIQYERALFSKGALLAPQNISAMALAGNVLEFVWVNNSHGNALANDQLMVVIYQATGGFYEFFLNVGAREDATATIVLPLYLAGSEVHCWAFMVAEQSKLKSTSQYLGVINVL